jgi:hypothetical protein
LIDRSLSSLCSREKSREHAREMRARQKRRLEELTREVERCRRAHAAALTRYAGVPPTDGLALVQCVRDFKMDKRGGKRQRMELSEQARCVVDVCGCAGDVATVVTVWSPLHAGVTAHVKLIERFASARSFFSS